MQALMGSAAGEQVFEELRNATVIALCHKQMATLTTGATGGRGGWWDFGHVYRQGAGTNGCRSAGIAERPLGPAPCEGRHLHDAEPMRRRTKEDV